MADASSPGLFFSFDGIDGAGKSTQIARFAAWLEGLGQELIHCRDPGSTPLGEAIRDILLHREEISLALRAEMLLYMAARAQLVAEAIAPALAAGKTVVSDRFLLANVVYQGHAGGLDPAEIWEIGRLATGGVSPDLTFLLDVPEECVAVRQTGPADRLEKRGAEYRRRLREGYLAEAGRNPDGIAVIEASGSIEAVAAAIQRAAEKRLGQLGRWLPPL